MESQLVDYSADRPKKGVTARHTIVRGTDFITTQSGRLKYKFTPIEQAQSDLVKSLAFYEEINEDERRVLAAEMVSLPSLIHMNPTILAGAIYMMRRNNGDINSKNFNKTFDDTIITTLDLTASTEEERSMIIQKNKEAIFRYAIAIFNFRNNVV